MSGAGATGSVVGIVLTMMAVLFVFLIIGIAFAVWYMKRASFNVAVTVLRPIAGTSSFIKEVGYRGKQYFDKSRKEMRFSIYNGKRLKLQYNGEAIDQKFFVKRMFKGRVFNEVYLTPNEAGYLQPTKLSFDDSLTGALKATVTNADITYYQTELEMLDSMFGNKSFMERYYLLILVVLFLLCLCILWYMAHEVGVAADTQHQTGILITNALKEIGARSTQTINATSGGVAQQVVALG